MQLKSLCLALGLAALTLPVHADTQPAASPAAAPAATPAAAPAQIPVDPNTPIARVNGVVLNAISLSLLREEYASRKQGPQHNDEYLRDSLVNAEIMAQEAVKLGLDKPIGVVAALEMNRKELLGRALVENHMDNNPVSDERIKTEYERLKAKAGGTEYQASHILVADEKLAKDLIAKLGGKKPAKFDALAKANSKDSSAKNGGDLGWMAPANLVPEFAEAMTKLKPGEYTKAPVKTQFGWHIIKLEASRPIAFPELDKVKGRIANQLAQSDIREYVMQLRASAKVEVPSSAAPASANPAQDPATQAK